MITTSIIVLNYNGEKIISGTINSILKLKYPKANLEIIIADNKSTDNSLEIINKFPVTIIKHKKNYGFAKGNNLAIKQAKGKYIVLLNNDCIVDPNWLTELINTAKIDNKIFSVTSKVKTYPIKSNQIQNAGSMVFQDGYGRDIGAIVTTNHSQSYENDIDQYNQPKEVYSSCGASVLYKKEILDTIGLLDENFFLYYEDTEISERANLAGFKNFYCPTAIVYHHHAKSSHEWSPFFIYNVEKGRLLHIFLHFPLYIFIQEFTKFFFKSIIRTIRHPTKFVNLSVSINLLLHLPLYIIKRKKLE